MESAYFHRTLNQAHNSVEKCLAFVQSTGYQLETLYLFLYTDGGQEQCCKEDTTLSLFPLHTETCMFSFKAERSLFTEHILFCSFCVYCLAIVPRFGEIPIVIQRMLALKPKEKQYIHNCIRTLDKRNLELFTVSFFYKTIVMTIFSGQRILALVTIQQISFMVLHKQRTRKDGLFSMSFPVSQPGHLDQITELSTLLFLLKQGQWVIRYLGSFYIKQSMYPHTLA